VASLLEDALDLADGEYSGVRVSVDEAGEVVIAELEYQEYTTATP